MPNDQFQAAQRQKLRTISERQRLLREVRQEQPEQSKRLADYTAIEQKIRGLNAQMTSPNQDPELIKAEIKKSHEEQAPIFFAITAFSAKKLRLDQLTKELIQEKTTGNTNAPLDQQRTPLSLQVDSATTAAPQQILQPQSVRPLILQESTPVFAPPPQLRHLGSTPANSIRQQETPPTAVLAADALTQAQRVATELEKVTRGNSPVLSEALEESVRQFIISVNRLRADASPTMPSPPFPVDSTSSPLATEETTWAAVATPSTQYRRSRGPAMFVVADEPGKQRRSSSAPSSNGLSFSINDGRNSIVPQGSPR